MKDAAHRLKESSMRSTVPRRTAKDALSAALRTTKLALPARVLFLRVPRLREVCEALAWHFTDVLPYPQDDWNTEERPLLNVCLIHAFSRAEAVFEANGHPQVSEVMSEFLAGLFYVAHYAQNVTVEGKGGEVWNPFSDEPLGSWITTKAPLTIDAKTVPDRPLLATSAARISLLRRLVGGATLAELGGLLQTVYDQEGRK